MPGRGANTTHTTPLPELSCAGAFRTAEQTPQYTDTANAHPELPKTNNTVSASADAQGFAEPPTGVHAGRNTGTPL